ncbi:MAG: DUF86 domain-containing protein [Bacteroides sp.]|nr:DUF86 domain-containing protein [Bacteroides sp.]
MRYLSKNEVADRLRFVESQTVFVLETTAKINTANDFLMSQDGMVLFNSTCMCLQSIGETIRQIDDRTDGKLLLLYPETPWKKIIGMRNFLSHEYFSIAPSVIYATVKTRLYPLLDDVRRVLADVEAGLRDDVI